MARVPCMKLLVAVITCSSLLITGCTEFVTADANLDGAQIAGSQPADGASGVSVDATITITFIKAAVPDSLGGEIDPDVAYTLQWSADARTLSVIPSASLAFDTAYTVTISELSFEDGTTLTKSHSIHFTTQGTNSGIGDAVSDKWKLWSSGSTKLRGANLHPCRLFNSDSAGDCVELITRQDVQDLRNLGANLINASYVGLFTERPPYQVNSIAQTYLDDLIKWAEEIGIYVVIHFRTGPGRNEAAITGGTPLTTVWTDQAAHDAWIQMWRHTAEHYHGSSVVVGYNLMVEPHVNEWLDPQGTLTPAQFHQQHEGTLADWNAFARDITTAIREVDVDTPIIVGSLQWASASWFPVLEPTGDTRTVYSLHTYDPDIYTNQENAPTIGYPSVVQVAGESIDFNRNWLVENLRPALEFAQQNDVPIYVGEFGAFRWVPGAVTYVSDEMSLFEQYGWNYAFYVWRGDDVGFDGFNVEYGLERNNHAPGSGNPLEQAFTDRWRQNVSFPQ